MIIWCLTCRERILRTTGDFILGGPYSGNMFESVHDSKWAATMFPQRPDIKGGLLNCPRCMSAFIVRGELLTEHGVVKPGQDSIDTSFSVVNDSGEFAGRLREVCYSRELPAEPTIIDEEPKGEVVEQINPPEETDEQWGVGVVSPLLICPKCGREYKDQGWFDKHVAKCEG